VALPNLRVFWTVGDDTGPEVDALDGRPEVYAAHYAGEQATYEDHCRKLLKGKV